MTDGEVLSAYQGYVLNQNKASNSSFTNLQNYFIKSICENDNVSNIRLIELLIESHRQKQILNIYFSHLF